jgi:aarF domain-containing kinase
MQAHHLKRRVTGGPGASRSRAAEAAGARRAAQAAASAAARDAPRAGAARQQAARQQALQELLRETLDIALATGPRGVVRGWQAAGAVGGLAAEYAVAGRLDPPQVVLRKLFERLGTTYIKLGQFIASTPSLFPEEVVEEMQNCLDRAAPVPWQTVEAILRQDLGRPLREVGGPPRSRERDRACSRHG